MQRAILCVDDEKSILNGLQQQITRFFGDEFLLEFAQSVDEALEVMDDFHDTQIRVALVITDQMMPGKTGSDLIRHLNQAYPLTKCVLLTGYTENEVIDSLNTANLFSCLNKPWEMSELMELIHRCVKEVH
jgi:YesN/AraC family two-component response regulator